VLRLLLVLSCLLLVLISLPGCRGAKPGGRVDYSSERGRQIVQSSSSDSPLTVSCPVGMVLIPNGPTIYGPVEEKKGAPGDKEERLTMKAYCVDKYEYPNQPGESPMRSVTWVEAKNLCGTKGKRLCSEYEFEKACRGPSSTKYTYGDGYAEGACATSAQDYGLGQFNNCVSSFGAHDMSGGVYEWTSSGPGEGSGAASEMKFLRGGMAADNQTVTSSCTYRVRYAATSSGREVGFRCCAATTKEELSK
jgi:eukaryotic-like serine/threonine-protein kinase